MTTRTSKFTSVAKGFDGGVMPAGDGTNITNVTPKDASVTATKMGTSGMVVQSVYSSTAATATGTTTTPSDDTIPQNTEGTLFMSQQITPVSASNYILIEAVVVFSLSAAVNATVALHKDSVADALAATVVSVSAADKLYTVSLMHRVLAGSTSQQDFKIRIGGSGASTVYLNGYSGGRIFGGVCSSTIKITELRV